MTDVVMPLSDIIDQSRTLIVLGAGGVGKTSLSAALALQGAMRGRKVLCLTIDPAKRLANSMGLDALSDSPCLISEALLTKHGLSCQGELYAMILDKKQTFDDLIRKYTSDPDKLARIFNNRLYQYIANSLAGTQEYMAMEKLYAIQQEGDYDLVVVDTPPSSEVFGFLDAPDILIDAIDSPATRWLIQALGRSGSFSFGLVSKGAATVLKGLSWLTGAEFMSEISEFITELNALFGGFRQRAMRVRETLREWHVSYLVVTSTSPPALVELDATLGELKERQLSVNAVVFNRVQPNPGSCPELTDADLVTLFPAYEHSTTLLSKMKQAYQEEQIRAMNDRTLIEQFRRQEEGDSMLHLEVPLMAQDVHDLGGLAMLGEALLKPVLVS